MTLRRADRRAPLGPSEASIADALTAPSTSLARWAETTCAAVSPPWLVNHCLRCYAWGVLLAIRDDRAIDRELLWLAAMLHDLGVTDAHRAPADTCFAYHGALAARRMLVEQGASRDRAAHVADSICQHLNVLPNDDASAEARTLAAAAAFDTIGARYREIHRAFVDQIETRHPRLSLATELVAVMRERARVERTTRMAMLCRLGFLGRVRKAPFAP